jgi:hypothetical protein
MEIRPIARRIKKAYIGIGGVARPCFGSDNLEYYGVLTNSLNSSSYYTSTRLNNFILFGNFDAVSNSQYRYLYKYDSSMSLNMAVADDGVPKACNQAVTFADYAIFGSGNNWSYYTYN